jgi:N-acetylglutamate synthase-like GNAT family acetyltransferase
LLGDSYWAATRSRPAIEKSLQHSLVLGIYTGGTMVGLVRVTTDHAVFGWISDVIIHPAYRGQGLGTWLMECMLDHPTTRQLSRLGLATKDAHQWYETLGFQRHETMMLRRA